LLAPHNSQEVTMADVIKMDYEKMEEMAKCFQDSSRQLEDVKSAMQSIAQTMEGGALLGDGGQAFAGAIRDQLVPVITKLAEKLVELQGDVKGAEDDMKQADTTSKGFF
jgi:WXG100 family type VII secretion target